MLREIIPEITRGADESDIFELMLTRLRPELRALDDNLLNELNEQLSRRTVDSRIRWILQGPTKNEVALRKALPAAPESTCVHFDPEQGESSFTQRQNDIEAHRNDAPPKGVLTIEDAPLDLGFDDLIPDDTPMEAEPATTNEPALEAAPDADVTSMDDKALRDELLQMTERGDPATWYFGPARSRYLSLNYELNLRQTWAPAFRGLVRPTKNRGLSPNEVACSLDRQLIDLDWLHSRGVRTKIDSEVYKDLLNQDTFDRNLAEQFAKEKWKSDHKAKLLRIPAHISGQLCSLLPKGKKEVFREWESGFGPGRKRGKGRDFYESELRNKTRPNLIKDNLPKWLDLILVCKLLGERSASAKVVELYSLARGEKPHRTTVDASVKKIRALL